MSVYDDRERVFENQFVHAQELPFFVAGRRNRLLGEWAAALMELGPEETDRYCKEIVDVEFLKSDDDVISKLRGDLTSAGVQIDDGRIRAALDAKAVEARHQLDEGK